MARLPAVTSVADITMGEDPQLEAWVYHFLTENNIEYLTNPSIVASAAQLRFMVALQEGQVYLPCSDALFAQMYSRAEQAGLVEEYKKSWIFIVRLIYGHDLSKPEMRRVLSLCRYRFRQYLNARMLLPSRLVKRLVKVVLTKCGILDPFAAKKRLANARAEQVLQSPEFQQAINAFPTMETPTSLSLSGMRQELDMAETARLLRLSTLDTLWTCTVPSPVLEQEVVQAAQHIDCVRAVLHQGSEERKRILFIPDVAGGIMFDLALIRTLLRQGHEVVLALKEFFYFKALTLWDLEDDPVIKKALGAAHVLDHNTVSKNELLQLLREHRFLVISDGTSEQLNLYRTSVAFARAWKECDLILAKGRRNKEILLGTSHLFTRDILAFWREQDGTFAVQAKPRAEWAHKFSEKDLLAKAKEITDAMRAARAQGKTVMFYSAVIGSIPGQTDVAISLVNTFVETLRSRMDGTFIINPAEHFVEGMDGDDLMYMWENVQRSGLLDVWRFQTVPDIEASFALLGRKVPSVWSGKDATFSTGCTKEMHIALEVQRKHPELQIIGPSPERFFRRNEYGVGKYYDATLTRTDT